MPTDEGSQSHSQPQFQPQSQLPPQSQQQQKRDFSESEEANLNSPTDQGTDGAKRRRTSPGTSSRSVANLNPDQLAKKRANDREAQRAIRERTKNQIEALEARIRDLTSQQPYQEVQHLLRQKEIVEAENADIKKRLASVMALIQPIIDRQGVETSTSYTPPTQPFVPTRPGSSSLATSTPNSAVSPIIGMGSFPQWSAPPVTMSHDPQTYSKINTVQAKQLTQKRPHMAHNLDIGSDRLGLDFLLDSSQRINKIPDSLSGSNDASGFVQMDTGSNLAGPVVRRASFVGSGNYISENPRQELTGHAAPIHNGPSTCPLDSILLDCLHERRQQAADGVAMATLVGPAYPSISALLNPANIVHSHPLSKVFTDILITFPEVSTLPEQVAILYTMFLLMRWQIFPTQDNYDRLPSWLAPRASQLFTAHPPWVDYLPWPRMRDRLARDYNPRDYLFDNFSTPFTSTISLNWPYEPTDVLLRNADGDDLVINPVFERHLRRLENWTLGPTFATAFPGLNDTYRLKIEGDRK